MSFEPSDKSSAIVPTAELRRRDVSTSRRVRLLGALRDSARTHWPLLLLLGLALLIRLAVAVAYRPALLWSDSWNYLYSAYSGTPVRIIPEKPVGYPLAIRLIGGPDHSLTLITAVQHVAGLATGAVVYFLLTRLGVSRLMATLASAVVLLDSYAIALEQHVMTESLFTLALVTSMYLAVLAVRRTPVLLAGASGVFLAGAVTMRVVALYAIPAWALYLVWSRVGWRASLTAVLGVALPLLAYAGVHAVKTGQFAMLQMDGYSLYARVGEIANCREIDVPARLEKFCPTRQPPLSRDPVDFYLYDPRSPALRAFGNPFTASEERRAVANDQLRDFALVVIQDRPIAFAKLLGSEFLKLFRPGAMSTLPGYDDPILLPERPRPIREQFLPFRNQYFPEYVPRVRAPAEILVEYQRWLHTPRWLLAIFSVVACITVPVGVLAGGRTVIPRRREIMLLAGAGLAILLGAVTAHFEPRYMIPAVPLLVGAGVLSLGDLAGAGRAFFVRLRERGRTERQTAASSN